MWLCTPCPFKRRCDEPWQFPALRTEFHGLVPSPCVQSMVFSSLAWLHQTSQLLSLCVAFFLFLPGFINEKGSSISASLVFQCPSSVLSGSETNAFVICSIPSSNVNVALRVQLLAMPSRTLTEPFSEVLYFPNSSQTTVHPLSVQTAVLHKTDEFLKLFADQKTGTK